MKLKTLTITDIRQIEPCYDPARYLPETWTGTAADILDVADCPAADRIWVATHFLPDSINRHFAAMVAMRALDEFYPTAQDAYACAMVADLIALGADVPDEERAAARAAASAAAWDAASAAARAAWAAWDAASDAASAAASDAAWAASDAAWSAWAAWAEQIDLLLWLIETSD